MKTVLSQTILAFILVFNSSTITVFAADFAVNTTVDAVDQNTADGDCLTAAGKCSLRAAVQQANASPGADRVILPVGTFYIEIIGAGETLGATGDFNITDTLEIVGTGLDTTIIDAGKVDRAFATDGSPFNLMISDVTIRNGKSTAG